MTQTTINQTKKVLNNEDTFKNRESHRVSAQRFRNISSRRSDALETTNIVAYGDMIEYIQSDSMTLDTHRESEVASFYAGRSIFVTGTSGFVGKCLLEKLLRSCPEINKIFILMRPKKGQDVTERVESVLRSELFNRLRNSSRGPEQLNKIVAVKGDITKPLFGLSQQDIAMLDAKVSLIIHSAATVKFAEPLKTAVENNVVSVDNLINLASKLSKLQALVHVSTAYSNCDRKQVDEVFYEAPVDADKLIDMSNWMQPDMFEKISSTLVGKRPNTYTFTKAVAESLLVERAKKLLPDIPIAMVRPSIVAGIWRQPICGWVDNFNGPTGVILSFMTGAIQAMNACADYCADIVPVDIVANLIICTAWQIHEQHQKSKSLITPMKDAKDETVKQVENIGVFNCVSGTLNPVQWKDFSKYIQQIGVIYPCNNVMRPPATLLISSQFLYNLFDIINHKTFAYAGDFLLYLSGKKPKLMIVYNRMYKMVQTLKPFTTEQWLFKCTNVTNLYEKLSPVDQEIFNFDIRQVRWDDYLRRYYIGSKIFALKDDPNQVVRARIKLNRIKWGSRFAHFLLLLLLYQLILKGTQMELFLVTISHTILEKVAELAPLEIFSLKSG